MRPDCDGTRHVIDELRAGAGSDGRVLTFARRVKACEPSRTHFFAMAMGCPCFIVAVILFFLGTFMGGIDIIAISIYLFMLSAAGGVAGCCCAAICSAIDEATSWRGAPRGEDDVEAPAAAAAPHV